MRLRCEDIMKKDVITCLQTDTIGDVACKMRDANIGFVPVCDEDGRALGTVTDRDLCVRVLAEGKGAEGQVGDVMTREVIAIRPDDDLRHAEELLGRHQKSRILCLDPEGCVIGVLSLSDLAQIDEENVGETMREVTEREASP